MITWAPETPTGTRPELPETPLRPTWLLVALVLAAGALLGALLGLHTPRPLTAHECVKGGGYQAVSGGRAVCQLDVTLPEASR